MPFQDILPVEPSPYTPPSFEGFSVPTNIDLPDGGAEDAVNASSILAVLPVSTSDREYYILNVGETSTRLFFGGDAATWELDVRTPFIMIPNKLYYSTLPTSRLPVFAWSEGGVGSLIVGAFA